ncbi:MAG TPA: carboxypeptidase-like regulatory domain-containing protein [Pyrinomonadaceae bacterium]|jgi:hypothetical protein|nr:carboxypeptidase-like regulatory domain-containing protein [Pyrinomonadaceae bacterium]
MKSRPFVLTLVIFTVLILSGDVVSACECGPKPNVLDEFQEANLVFIARIVSIDKVDPKSKSESEEEATEGVRSATLRVEKIYKGNLRLRQELVFAPGNGADCLFTFQDSEIGDQMLLYMSPPEKRTDRFVASFCGRSRGLEGATEDLLYLDNMKKFRGKTRVSGRYGLWQSEDFIVANKKILIRGENKTYETKTDEKGFFEIYDLPPGKYFLEPEMPKGWKIARMWLQYVADIEEEQPSKKSIAFTLRPKSHASIDVSFESDNAIAGTVLDPNGNPIQGVNVHLWGATQTAGYGSTDTTDEKGEFRIESVPAGIYVLLLNSDGKISSAENFERLFYPGVAQREKATLIHINDGEVVTGINIVIPKLFETVKVSGTLQYSDETPVDTGRVELVASPVVGMDGAVRTYTDSEGRFTLQILKGMTGQIYGELYVSADSYVDCPKLDELLQAKGERFTNIETPPIRIEANQDMENLVLKLPFPRCKKKK